MRSFYFFDRGGYDLMNDFMPHGSCLLWDPFLLWAMVACNGAIFISYMIIAVKLYGVRKVLDRQHIVRNMTVLFSFAVFIFLCGVTHLMDVITLWFPRYYVTVAILAMTAIASVFTAITFPKLVKSSLEKQAALEKQIEGYIGDVTKPGSTERLAEGIRMLQQVFGGPRASS